MARSKRQNGGRNNAHTSGPSNTRGSSQSRGRETRGREIQESLTQDQVPRGRGTQGRAVQSRGAQGSGSQPSRAQGQTRASGQTQPYGAQPTRAYGSQNQGQSQGRASQGQGRPPQGQSYRTQGQGRGQGRGQGQASSNQASQGYRSQPYQSRQTRQPQGGASQSGSRQRRPYQAPPQATKQKKAKRSALSKVLLIAGILLILASLGIGGFLAYQYLSARSAYSDVVKAAAVDESTLDASTLQVDWDALREINPDVVGWVLIPGTNVNYPVVKTSDNNYYLEHLFNRSPSKAGAVFLDCDAQPDFSCRNSLIYGHNLIDGSMFSSVTKYVDSDFFEEHHEVLLATPTRNYRLRAVCSLVWDGGDGSIRQANFEGDEDFHSFVQSLLDRAAIRGDFAAQDVDKMICLVTCSYQTDNSRTVLCLTPVKTYDPDTGLEYLEG